MRGGMEKCGIVKVSIDMVKMWFRTWRARWMRCGKKAKKAKGNLKGPYIKPDGVGSGGES